jgi:hypothetical protein
MRFGFLTLASQCIFFILIDATVFTSFSRLGAIGYWLLALGCGLWAVGCGLWALVDG